MQQDHPWSTHDFVNHNFATTGQGFSYDIDEVDRFLDRCVAQLRVHRCEPAVTHETSMEALRLAARDRSKGLLTRWFARWALRQLVRQAADPALAIDVRPIHSSEVVQHGLTVTPRRDGYVPDDVDEVLDRMAAALAEHERDLPSAGPAER